MQRLILLRHGKTEAVSASGADIDRALTARGHDDAALMGRVLASAGVAPNLVLVSSALRASETWAGLAPSFPLAEVRIEPAIYLASVERLAGLIDDQQKATSLMVVGHNPGLHELAAIRSTRGQAADRERLIQGFPTAAAAILAQTAGGDWTLERLLTPRDFRGDPG
jgi:phosphohistidine phosphatase